MFADRTGKINPRNKKHKNKYLLGQKLLTRSHYGNGKWHKLLDDGNNNNKNGIGKIRG